MTYSLHRSAEQDLLEAAQFYRREIVWPRHVSTSGSAGYLLGTQAI